MSSTVIRIKHKELEIKLLCFIILIILPITLEEMQRKCYSTDRVLRVRHNSCFLRPDTGPCRADIVQYYYDAKASRCFQFFWGGCQGNGNRFESKRECLAYCHLENYNDTRKPTFCELPFSYGSCFGHYIRWYWDRYNKICKRGLYSGCGGNQNNFQSMDQCSRTCFLTPGNTLTGAAMTTCFPLYEIRKKK